MEFRDGVFLASLQSCSLKLKNVQFFSHQIDVCYLNLIRWKVAHDQMTHTNMKNIHFVKNFPHFPSNLPVYLNLFGNWCSKQNFTLTFEQTFLNYDSFNSSSMYSIHFYLSNKLVGKKMHHKPKWVPVSVEEIYVYE